MTHHAHNDKYKWARILGSGLIAAILSLLAFRFIPQYIHVEHLSPNLRAFILSSTAKATSRDISIIGIDEHTASGLPYVSPIDRRYLGALILNISRYKPRSIVVDMVFDRPTEPEKDQEFLDIVRNQVHVPIVFAYSNCHEDCPSGGVYEREFLKKTGRVFGYATFVETSEKKSEPFLVERVPKSKGPLCNLSSLIVDPRCRTPDREDRPIDWQRPPRDGQPLFDAFLAQELPPIGDGLAGLLSKDRCDGGTATVVAPLAIQLDAALAAQKIHCRTIVIGKVMKDEDVHQIPIVAVKDFPFGKDFPEETPGVFIHAIAAQQILEHRTLIEAGPVAQILFTIAFGLLGALMTLYQKINNRLYFIVAVAFVFSIIDGSSYLLFRYLVPGAQLSLAFLLGIQIGNASRILIKHKATGVLMENLEILA